jgi:hypothetical protein
MLTVTNPALDRLSRKLARKKADDDEAMRFTRRKCGWRLRLDRARPDDTAFTYEGRNVLLLDAAVAKAMAPLTLDARNTGQRARLKLRNTERRGD